MISFIKWIFFVIKDAAHLDVRDFCYLYKPHNIKLKTSLQAGVPRRGLAIRLGSFFFHLVNSFWKYPLKFANYPRHSIVFFAITQNQDRALRPIVKGTRSAFFVGLNQFGDHQLPLFWAYMMAFPFLPLVFIKFVFSNSIQREAFYYVFDSYWLSYGYYILTRWMLWKRTPTATVMANDHLMQTRVLIEAAAAEKVPTIYVQHASVTERFPPLTVNYALLEGVDSAQKYAACGSSFTEVYLVGVPRFDKYYSMIRGDHNLHMVGICAGISDSYEQITSLCQMLDRYLPELNYTLRPHPGDPRRTMWEEFAIKIDWRFSNGVHEDTFKFLNGVDVILAGDSNILLEAALMNVFPMYIDFTAEKLDWYGFHENGLVPYFSNADLILTALKKMIIDGRPFIRSKAKRYCATIDTEFDGRSNELALDLINQILQRGEIDGKKWRRVTSIDQLAVFEIEPYNWK